MAIATLSKYPATIFHDPWKDFEYLTYKVFPSKEKAKEWMDADFNRRFDADSDASFEDSKITIKMLDETYVYEVADS